MINLKQIFVFILIPASLFGQESSTILDFRKNKTKPIRFNIQVPVYEFHQYKNTDFNGFSASSIIYNDLNIPAKKIDIHGQSTKAYYRKSFNINLQNSIPIPFADKLINLDEFYLISMNMDRHYVHNVIAFQLLKELGLFTLNYTYCVLSINSVNQGIYLLVEKPHEHIFQENKAKIIIRRGKNNSIRKIYSSKKVDSTFIQKVSNQFTSLYDINKINNDESKQSQLDALLNTKQYYRFLAFNIWLKNGDYTDELYFYKRNLQEPFQLHAWDFDDIFEIAPHEGIVYRQKRIGNKLLFSAEDSLDIIIANNTLLYANYLYHVRQTLDLIDESTLRGVFEETYFMLYPYVSRRKNIKPSKKDKWGKTTQPYVEQYLQDRYEYLILEKTRILNLIN